MEIVKKFIPLCLLWVTQALSNILGFVRRCTIFFIKAKYMWITVGNHECIWFPQAKTKIEKSLRRQDLWKCCFKLRTGTVVIHIYIAVWKIVHSVLLGHVLKRSFTSVLAYQCRPVPEQWITCFDRIWIICHMQFCIEDVLQYVILSWKV